MKLHKTLISRFAKDSELLSRIGLTFVSRGFSAFGTLALSFVLGRIMGAAGVGLFMLAFSLVTGLGVLARFGMDSALLRFVGIAYCERDRTAYREIKIKAYCLATALSLICACMLYFGQNWIAISLFKEPNLSGLVSVMSLVLPFYTHIYLQATFLKALQRPALAPFFETGSVAFFTSIIVLVCFFVWGGQSPNVASWSLLIATLGCFVFGQYVLWRTESRSFPVGTSSSDGSEGFFTSLPNYAVMSLTSFSVQWGALLILGAFVSADQVGLYSVAHRMAFVVNFILMVFNSVIAPQFAYLYKEGRMEELERLAVKSTNYMTCFATPVLLGFVLFPEDVLRAFGQEFVKGGAFLVCLSVAQFVNVATGSVGFLLNMTGGERCMRNIVVIAGVTSISLSFALCPFIGAWGAVISTSVGLVMQNLIAAWWVYKKLGIRTIPGWAIVA